MRGIIETLMRDLMYALPSDPDVTKVVITKQMVLGKGKAKIYRNTQKKKADDEKETAS